MRILYVCMGIMMYLPVTGGDGGDGGNGGDGGGGSFSSLARIWGECSTIHSPPALFFFFFLSED